MGTDYQVTYHKKVLTEDVLSLGDDVKRRIKVTIEQKLQSSPELYGKPLRGSIKGYWKLRVGKYRIVYRIQKQTVVVLAIAHRSTVYTRMSGRKK